MSSEPRDILDRQIDEVLRSISAEQPRRVGAASVRRALETRRAAPLPVWFAAAAVLMFAIGVVVNRRAPAEKAPEVIARSTGADPVPARVTPTGGPEPVAPTTRTRPARPRPGADSQVEPPYEGLPRLVVAAIDVPEPLSLGLLSGEAIQIPRIEITPLVVTDLPTDHEPR